MTEQNDQLEAINEYERTKLHIADLNSDIELARRKSNRGSLTRLAKGVYIDAKLSPLERRQLIIKNAIRITKRMYPNAILAGSSAYHRGVVEGTLAILTPRGGVPVDVGGVFTIYNRRSDLDLSLNNEVQMVSLNDSFGEHYIRRVSDEILILKNFYPSKTWPRQTYLNNADLNRVIERAIRTCGGREAFNKRMEVLARSTGMSHFMGKVMDYVDGTENYVQAAKPMMAFSVYWHKSVVATLNHDGHIWNFEYNPLVQLQLSLNEAKGRGSPPSFLASLLPEIGLKADTKMEDNLEDFRRGHRYISNITVLPQDGVLDRSIIQDRLDGELSQFRNKFLAFRGTPDRSITSVMEDDDLMDSLHRDPNSPRMSGMQIKVAANLDRKGILSSATGKAFTHIIKLVGSNPRYQSMCSMEWFSLTIAKMCGLNVEEFAIADLGGYGPALVVERFDVRRDLNDRRMILTEDFWSIEGLTENRQKYAGELMNVASTLVKHSTDLEADARQLLTQAAISWLTSNGDLHLKNLLIVKETLNPGTGFDSVRLSPAYDLLCTQVYPDDAKSAAIALQGSRNHTLAGFRALGKKMGVRQEEVDSIVGYLVAAIPHFAAKVAENLPAVIRDHEQSMKHISKARDLFDVRCAAMLKELDAAAENWNRKTEVESGSFSAEPMDSVDPSPLGAGAGEEYFKAQQRRSMQANVAPRTKALRRPG